MGRWCGKVYALCSWDAELKAFQKYNRVGRRGLRVIKV
jgi:hypothetical protein